MKKSVYTKGLNVDACMLSKISNIFVLVDLGQFRSLRYFLVQEQQGVFS